MITSSLRPPPTILLALAASKENSSYVLEMSIESSVGKVKASKSISVDTAAQEAEVTDTPSSNTLSAWEEDNMILQDNNVGTTSDDIAVDKEDNKEATFDAGYRKNANSSASIKRAFVNPPSGDALEVRARRNSGAVDALRALIEGTREKEGDRET